MLIYMTKLILSLDGGGIKGTIVVEFLRELEDHLGKPLHEVFDMFIGTSTGALIASTMGYQGLSANQIADLYSVENANRIMPQSCWNSLFGIFEFKPKYSGKGKTTLINKYITNTTANVPTIIPYYAINRKQPMLYKSYERHFAPEMTIQQAVDMSSSAPAFFPAVSAHGICGIDGGVFANNPTEIGYIHGMEYFKDEDNDIRVLSIGCGLDEETYKPCSYYKSIGGIQWVTSGEMLDLLMGSPAQISDQKMKFMTRKLGHKYLRVNEIIKNNSMDDVSQQNIDILRQEGINWFHMYKDRLNVFFNINDK